MNANSPICHLLSRIIAVLHVCGGGAGITCRGHDPSGQRVHRVLSRRRDRLVVYLVPRLPVSGKFHVSLLNDCFLHVLNVQCVCRHELHAGPAQPLAPCPCLHLGLELASQSAGVHGRVRWVLPDKLYGPVDDFNTHADRRRAATAVVGHTTWLCCSSSSLAFTDSTSVSSTTCHLRQRAKHRQLHGHKLRVFEWRVLGQSCEEQRLVWCVRHGHGLHHCHCIGQHPHGLRLWDLLPHLPGRQLQVRGPLQRHRLHQPHVPRRGHDHRGPVHESRSAVLG